MSGKTEAKSRLRLSRLQWAIAIGAILIVVPTAFTVFPELARLHIGWRLLVSAIWVIIVVIAVRSGTIRDLLIYKVTEGLTVERIELRRQLETTALAETIRVLLLPSSFGIPECYEFTVYMHDPENGSLLPIYPAWTETGDDFRIFQPGNGATGQAWANGAFFVVKDEAVSNQNYGLTDEQQERWQGYVRAIAYPLYEDLTDPFGVLTAIAEEPDDFFDAPAGRALFRDLANIVALILLRISPSPTDSVTQDA